MGVSANAQSYIMAENRGSDSFSQTMAILVELSVQIVK